MINFRFHIVSITAVLLALGIGLLLGTTFLDDATVEGLRNQLDGLETDLDRAEERNDEQQAQLGAFQEEADLLDEQGERLFDGRLSGKPVLVVATRGIDQAWVDSVMRALAQADADVRGAWWLTDRLLLDDDDEVSDMSDALELSTDETDRLERNLALQLGDVLYGAADPPESAADAPGGASAGGAGAAEAEDSAEEPALLTRLRDAGFVEYQMPEGVDGDVVSLPASGLRIVIVDGPDASVPPGRVLVPVLDAMTVDGPVPVVAAQPTVVEGDDVDPGSQPQLVQAVRDDDELVERVSGVDALDRVSGMAATVLATVDAEPGAPTIGQYGTADGADRLLPPAADES